MLATNTYLVAEWNLGLMPTIRGYVTQNKTKQKGIERYANHNWFVYVIGLHAVLFGKNWWKKFLGKPKLDEAVGLNRTAC